LMAGQGSGETKPKKPEKIEGDDDELLG
jgi:hypothetical protein